MVMKSLGHVAEMGRVSDRDLENRRTEADSKGPPCRYWLHICNSSFLITLTSFNYLVTLGMF